MDINSMIGQSGAGDDLMNEEKNNSSIGSMAETFANESAGSSDEAGKSGAGWTEENTQPSFDMPGAVDPGIDPFDPANPGSSSHWAGMPENAEELKGLEADGPSGNEE